jgi:hypothetical protein
MEGSPENPFLNLPSTNVGHFCGVGKTGRKFLENLGKIEILSSGRVWIRLFQHVKRKGRVRSGGRNPLTNSELALKVPPASTRLK